MHKSLIFATIYEESIIFGKESFINVRKVLNFIVLQLNKVMGPNGAP